MLFSSIVTFAAPTAFFLTVLVDAKVSKNNLRNKAVEETSVEHRRLNWEMLAPGYTDVTNDVWYSDYSTNEIPTETSPWADTEDKFRTNDLCIKNGVYARENCPTEIDCSHLSDAKIGPAKLCINRVPTATGMWYVLLQKCIPDWENCDKCLCGVMTSSGSNGVCVFDPNCDSDDSRIAIDCSNPSKITVMGGYTFNSATGEGFVNIESLQMTNSNEESSPKTTTKAPSPSPADSISDSGTAANPTEPPASAPAPTDPPVSAPAPTEPPVSAPAPTEPPVSAPAPTEPPVSTPASEEQVDDSGSKKDDTTKQDPSGEDTSSKKDDTTKQDTSGEDVSSNKDDGTTQDKSGEEDSSKKDDSTQDTSGEAGSSETDSSTADEAPVSE